MPALPLFDTGARRSRRSKIKRSSFLVVQNNRVTLGTHSERLTRSILHDRFLFLHFSSHKSRMSFTELDYDTEGYFIRRFTIMPVPFNEPSITFNYVIGASGNDYPCRTLRMCFYDLRRHGYIYDDDLEQCIDALHNHQFRGIMPGTQRFWSIFSDEWVYFTELVDDVMAMYRLAVNFADLTDDEDEENHNPQEIDLYEVPFPEDIGRFRLNVADFEPFPVEELFGEGIDMDDFFEHFMN